MTEGAQHFIRGVGKEKKVPEVGGKRKSRDMRARTGLSVPTACWAGLLVNTVLPTYHIIGRAKERSLGNMVITRTHPERQPRYTGSAGS